MWHVRGSVDVEYVDIGQWLLFLFRQALSLNLELLCLASKPLRVLLLLLSTVEWAT